MPLAAETQKPIEPTVHPLLQACTAREQKFILALVADPTNQTKAYESAFKARGESASANAARLLGKDRVRVAFDALTAEVRGAEQSAAIATAKERRELLTVLQRDTAMHPLARLKAIDIQNKMDGEYIERREITGEGGGPVEVRFVDA